MISPEKGAETPVYLATAPKLEAKSGQYFYKKKIKKPAAIANDTNARDNLWALSEGLVRRFEV
ncbi:hypothetical protein HK413_00095 [Mucilaginibacter sp. S1162]|uniref:Uncharacterized protein n=1 Tax=Mucilaginibacter humi TaxID=2732510 RepID=A0ABX1VYL9_9SPHI|nr:hypothetical protein [Mucilaginibacter humi]NNU32995.1 hypothetical protein [Mucilaginibacter humi]